MRLVDYLENRSQELVKAAAQRVKIIDELLQHIDDKTSLVTTIPRQGTLLAVLQDARRNLVATRDAAQRVIVEAQQLRLGAKP